VVRPDDRPDLVEKLPPQRGELLPGRLCSDDRGRPFRDHPFGDGVAHATGVRSRTWIMSAVRPLSLPFECCSPLEMKAASPSASGLRAPSLPATQPLPATAKRIWPKPASCGPISPPGSK